MRKREQMSELSEAYPITSLPPAHNNVMISSKGFKHQMYEKLLFLLTTIFTRLNIDYLHMVCMYVFTSIQIWLNARCESQFCSKKEIEEKGFRHHRFSAPFFSCFFFSTIFIYFLMAIFFWCAELTEQRKWVAQNHWGKKERSRKVVYMVFIEKYSVYVWYFSWENICRWDGKKYDVRVVYISIRLFPLHLLLI